MSDMEDKDESFLSRWSRRKVAAREGETLPEPVQAEEEQQPRGETPAASLPAAEPPVELPAVDTLKGLESDYKDFMHPEVDASTRRAALKKLFADAHFNQMDGLDVYIDDYSQPDPIPLAMLKGLQQARSLLLFDEDENKPEAVAAADAAPPQASADAGSTQASADAGSIESDSPAPTTDEAEMSQARAEHKDADTT